MFGWIISERVLGFRFPLRGFIFLSNPKKIRQGAKKECGGFRTETEVRTI